MRLLMALCALHLFGGCALSGDAGFERGGRTPTYKIELPNPLCPSPDIEWFPYRCVSNKRTWRR